MRVIRIVEAVLYQSSWRLPARHVFRVIECDEGASGCPLESDVVELWQSDHFDQRSTTGPRAVRLREAQEVARLARQALEVGLRADAPAEMVWDLLEERGLDPTAPVLGRGGDRPAFVNYPEGAARRPA
jgi:hypothetical protein